MKGRTFLLLCGLTYAAPAAANPRPLPMTYGYETPAQGEMEVEQYIDLIPLKAFSAQGDHVDYLGMQFQTELEYGLTHRLELGLYLTLAPTASDALSNTASLPVGNGIKQRLRYRIGDPEAWPVDVGVYGELTETQTEFELEAKVILQRRLGPVRLMANLSSEREFYFSGRSEWVLNPSAGVTVELTPRFHVGAETWWWTEWPDKAPATRTFNLGPHGYAGPCLMVSLNRFWWSAGAYLRVTDRGHQVGLGDAFGNVWIRTVVGVSL